MLGNEQEKITNKKLKQAYVGKDKWTIHLIGIPRLIKQKPAYEFAKAFGFRNSADN